MAKLTIVVARAHNGIIGRDNQLPWNLPEDLKHFKDYTNGKPIIMGRKTHESIGRILPGRTNVVVSRNPDYRSPGAFVVNSLKTALELVIDAPEVCLIGGGSLYEEALKEDLVDTCIITEVHANYEGDTVFPVLDMEKWSGWPLRPLEFDGDNKKFTVMKYERNLISVLRAI
jgi:dihydrofolate reductase